MSARYFPKLINITNGVNKIRLLMVVEIQGNGTVNCDAASAHFLSSGQTSGQLPTAEKLRNSRWTVQHCLFPSFSAMGKPVGN